MNPPNGHRPQIDFQLAMLCMRLMAQAIIEHKKEQEELPEEERIPFIVDILPIKDGVLTYKVSDDGKQVMFDYLKQKEAPRIIVPGAH